MKKLLKLSLINLFFITCIHSQNNFHDIVCKRPNLLHKINQLNKQINHQKHIDIKFYDISLSIDLRNKVLSGNVITKLIKTSESNNKIFFDLSNYLTVEEVRVNDKLINFFHGNDILEIETPSIIENNLLTIEIKYNGIPYQGNNTGINFLDRFDQKLNINYKHLYTLSEPYAAKDWWPGIHDPSDKADSVFINVTTESGQMVVSNGLLAEVDSTSSENFVTFKWKEHYPIATYLVSLAIYPYDVWEQSFQSNSGKILPIYHYVFPDQKESFENNYNKTPEVLKILSGYFGEYPFIEEKYGHVSFLWPGGMEHQTISSMCCPDMYLIVHEAAHQWWGDMVTCKDFNNIWLNEGFATYAQALWYEKKEGIEARNKFMKSIEYFGTGSVFIKNPETIYDIFIYDLVYAKAAWVLHMLRKVVSEEIFWEIIINYRNDFIYSSVNTDDFKMVAEKTSGINLENFFNQWVYGENFPEYDIELVNINDSESIINIIQTQNGNIFNMPLDLLIITNVDTFQILIENNKRKQSVDIKHPNKILKDVKLDPNDWILKKVNYTGVDNLNIPKDFIIEKLFPNPFNNTVKISIDVPKNGLLNIIVFDLLGKKIKQIHNENISIGKYMFEWNGKNDVDISVQSGLYVFRIVFDGKIKTKKSIYLK